MHEPRVLQEPAHFPLAQSDQFEIKPTRRDAVTEWIKDGDLGSDDLLFPSRVHDSLYIGTKNHIRMLDSGLAKLDSIHRLMALTQRAVP